MERVVFVASRPKTTIAKPSANGSWAVEEMDQLFSNELHIRTRLAASYLT